MFLFSMNKFYALAFWGNARIWENAILAFFEETLKDWHFWANDLALEKSFEISLPWKKMIRKITKNGKNIFTTFFCFRRSKISNLEQRSEVKDHRSFVNFWSGQWRAVLRWWGLGWRTCENKLKIEKKIGNSLLS